MPERLAIIRAVAIALACGAALAGTNWLTQDRIRYNEAAALRAAVADLLPADVRLPERPVDLDRAPAAWRLCSGHLLGRSDASGYNSAIRLLYTLLDDRLIRVSLLGHQETPGITDFLNDPDWLSRFDDARAEEVEALAAITGATITSVAVRDHLAAVLQDPTERLGEPLPQDCVE